uniref:BPTI/Kunitz inhibitor domain-containing protein n=1 Tax=Varanus komodoensis TaxID=61221 RepID=A0A8D2IKE8_VARKO
MKPQPSNGGSAFPPLCFRRIPSLYSAFSEILFLSPPGPYPSICKLPRAVGRCRASFHRYYFDISTEKCIPFTYGGCRGNANNFLSAQGCYLVCKIFGK